MPTSCQDVWLIGHTLNEIYSVVGSAMMESIYCDITQLPGEEGFEKWIGYDDVKWASNLFFVQRNTWFNSMNTPIPFEIEQINAGNVMDLASGKFTAPRTGIYFFSFTGHADFPALSSSSTLAVSLLLDGGQIARGFVEDANTVKNQSSQVIVQSTLNLKSGNQVWMEIFALSSGVSLAHDTHLTGFMLEEEIVISV